jgi:hypothetical protein
MEKGAALDWVRDDEGAADGIGEGRVVRAAGVSSGVMRRGAEEGGTSGARVDAGGSATGSWPSWARLGRDAKEDRFGSQLDAAFKSASKSSWQGYTQNSVSICGMPTYTQTLVSIIVQFAIS